MTRLPGIAELVASYNATAVGLESVPTLADLDGEFVEPQDSDGVEAENPASLMSAAEAERLERLEDILSQLVSKQFVLTNHENLSAR